MNSDNNNPNNKDNIDPYSLHTLSQIPKFDKDKDLVDRSYFECFYEPPKQQKEKRKMGVLAALLILLPIFLIVNVFATMFTFKYIWNDYKAELETEVTRKVSEEIGKHNNLPVDAEFVAQYVSSNNIQRVIEINCESIAFGTSAGTGFVVTESGYILTNAHVITYEKSAGIGPFATKKSIYTHDSILANFANSKSTYELEVVNYDADLDIAVLKFKNTPNNLRPVKFGDSSLLQYGEPAVAIGNARGYGMATTSGVISSPMQSFDLSGSTRNAIQHDAPINPGNSGGPLFNLYGLVVGINTFKLTNSNTTVTIDGMGFAIPTVVVKDYVNGLNLPDLKIQFTSPAK